MLILAKIIKNNYVNKKKICIFRRTNQIKRDIALDEKSSKTIVQYIQSFKILIKKLRINEEHLMQSL